MAFALVSPDSSFTPGGMIRRMCGKCTLTLNSTIGSCDALAMAGWAGGAITIPTSVTALTFHGSVDGVTFYAIHDNTDAAVAPSVTAGTFFTLPDEVFSHAYIKAVPTGANGTATVVCKS